MSTSSSTLHIGLQRPSIGIPGHVCRKNRIDTGFHGTNANGVICGTTCACAGILLPFRVLISADNLRGSYPAAFGQTETFAPRPPRISIGILVDSCDMQFKYQPSNRAQRILNGTEIFP
jgi:hypothetical protein